MAKKTYKFNYDFYKAQASFEVDLEKFTPELAYETLTFFSWDYDHEADPIHEVMKKYALHVLRIGGNSSKEEIITDWNEEGFAPLDGSMGILLREFDGFEFDEDELEMEVING